jgi:hypothetical protein
VLWIPALPPDQVRGAVGMTCLIAGLILAGDLDLIEKSESGPLKKDIAEIERMLKALIKSLENKPLNP